MRKTVLVTGGSRGIGAAAVRELASSGYDVVINCIHSVDKAEALKAEIEENCGIRALVCRADVSKEEDVERMHEEIASVFGGVDVLINNAGIDLSNLFSLKTAEEFRRTLDVNVVGAYLCAKTFAPYMQEKGWGRIINVSSTNGINTYYPMSIDYDASKAAMISLTHDLAVQYAPEIHVNCVAPGFIGTESELDGYDETFLKEECEKILVKRYGKPEEAAHLIRFLISDESDYINNTVIRIDGGQMGSC